MYIPIDDIQLVVEKYRQSFNEATNENSTEAPKVDKPTETKLSGILLNSRNIF